MKYWILTNYSLYQEPPLINCRKGQHLDFQKNCKSRGQNLIGFNSARLVFEVHPEEYLEEAYRKGQSYHFDKAKTISYSPNDYVIKDPFHIDLKTGSYTVDY